MDKMKIALLSIALLPLSPLLSLTDSHSLLHLSFYPLSLSLFDHLIHERATLNTFAVSLLAIACQGDPSNPSLYTVSLFSFPLSFFARTMPLSSPPPDTECVSQSD